MIREMGHADVEAVADLAQSERLLHDGRGPRLWKAASSGHHVHPLLLRRHIEAAATACLVDERHGAIVGAIIAAPIRDASSGWVVDDFVVRSAPEWETSGRALLAALGARASAAGIDDVNIACATIDLPKSRMLQSAGLKRASWIRHRRVPSGSYPLPQGCRLLVPADRESPWHWMHTVRPPLPTAAAIGDGALAGLTVEHPPPGGAVVMAATVTAPLGSEPDGPALLVGPFAFAAGEEPSNKAFASTIARLVEGLVAVCGERGFRHLLAACGPEAPELDRALAAEGFDEPWSWWRLAPPATMC